MNNYIQNPFQFEGAVTGSRFCGRTEDIKSLLEYMRNGSNVVISMKRRVGKTSVIKEVFENYAKDSRLIAGYCDIYAITSVKELYLTLKEEVESIVGKASKIGIASERIANAFSGAIVTATLGVSPKFMIEFTGNNYALLIQKLLLCLEDFAKINKIKIVFAIDEFQKIATLKKSDIEKIETNIRTAMQETKNISFVMSGSNQTMLDKMFSEDRPLYRQGVHYYLEPIAKDEFYTWVSDKFRLKEITISKDAFYYIYDLANTEAKIIQQFCFELFFRTDTLKNIEVHDVCNVAKQIYSKNSEIATKFNTLSLNEQKMMKVIALEKETGITVSPLLQEFDVNAGSVSNILTKMLEKYRIIKLEGAGNYEIVDTELKLWIKTVKNALC